MPPTRRTTNPRLLLPLPPPSTPSTSTSTPTATVTPTPTLPSPSSTRTPSHTHTHASPSPPRPAPTTDPLWHTMQSTLSTLPGHSGGSGSNVFFTAAHTRALDELRIAQMALAQAWMSDATSSPSGGEGAGGAAAWEKKRLASDAHFGRVASGVRDVAAKLDRVVDAMGDVEVESRGIWGGSTYYTRALIMGWDGWEHHYCQTRCCRTCNLTSHKMG
ncbi:hypothetical protein BZA05DRAFT_438651 [Tricharina praecox]|uniref:uncharacterized protein n=1 Tax=Tricharina praecox TaxID=43433 RepID=UPI00222129B2|nr:uncharacterized protein BZA05DRAFT_438651 [Tricharina praecox]KAI5845424.1 hypothetical protein BZA05DRAFT_438651 [Tricharina praecox]